MSMSRRHFMTALTATTGAATSLSPHGLAVGHDMPGWQLGYANAPAGGFAPMEMDLLSGRLPASFGGALYRNGPAWFTHGDEVIGHWFDGDGMVQKIDFTGGKAVHSGQFVSTPKRQQEMAAGRFLAPGFGSAGDESFAMTGPDSANAANTALLMMDGDLLALWEAGSPTALDPASLETRGLKTWREDLAGMPFLAHPKIEPNGTVWNLAIGGGRIGIYKIGATGRTEDFQLISTTTASYIHDWAMTDRHLLIMLQPWVQTRNLPPFVNSLEWRPDEALRVLIIDKSDFSQQRWAEVPAKAFFHTGAAWEDASGTIHIDVSLYDMPVLGNGAASNLVRGDYQAEADLPPARLSQIIIPSEGPARIVATDIDGEFPTVHPHYHGGSRRYTTLVGGETVGRPGATTLSVMDWQSGAGQHFNYGADRIAEEHLIVAKPGGRTERDAWVVGTVLNTRRRRSEVHIFDLANVNDGPVASFGARYAWPLGFHGTFAR